jgi:polyhydroxyalkanoate synthase subunit PhaC
LILHGRVIEQNVDRYESARFVKEIVVTKGEVPLVMVRKRYAANAGGTRAPVLLVHGFGQNRYAWHLPSRSFGNHLARLGYDVFNLDLRGHGRSRSLGARRCVSATDYILEDLPSAVDEVQRQSGGRPVYLVGHSLGGLVSYAAAPTLGSAIAGIATLGSPYLFTRGSISLSCVAFLFRAMATTRVPLGNPAIGIAHVGSVLNVLRRFAESPLYPVPWRGWHKAAIEHDVLEEHLRLAFDSAGLAEMADMFAWATAERLGGHELDYVEQFEKLDLPLLVIAGSNDDLAPPASVRPAHERSRSRDKTYCALPLGHIDLLVGRDAPLMTWPLLSGWLDARAPAASNLVLPSRAAA